jgi:hypothetical protein
MISMKQRSYRIRTTWYGSAGAPDCRRIEIADLPKKKDVPALLRMMGWETGNIHLGSPAKRVDILRDMERRKNHWLQNAAERMVDVTLRDWREWRRVQGSGRDITRERD